MTKALIFSGILFVMPFCVVTIFIIFRVIAENFTHLREMRSAYSDFFCVIQSIIVGIITFCIVYYPFVALTDKLK